MTKKLNLGFYVDKDGREVPFIVDVPDDYDENAARNAWAARRQAEFDRRPGLIARLFRRWSR